MRTIEQALAPYEVRRRPDDSLSRHLKDMPDIVVEALGNAMLWAQNYGSRSIVNPHRKESQYHDIWRSLEYAALDTLESRKGH